MGARHTFNPEGKGTTVGQLKKALVGLSDNTSLVALTSDPGSAMELVGLDVYEEGAVIFCKKVHSDH
jgi:hypothetical protein